MASVGHVAVGLAGSRFWAERQWPAVGSKASMMVFYAALAVLPDIDVLAFRLHIPYEARFGHRGAFHSLAFAVLVGCSVGLVQTIRRRRWLGLALLAAAVTASHGLLDALTDGGLGVALFWPFTEHRYFFVWRPIPVAPIGRSVLSEYGLWVALTELWMFSPLILYALWPRRSRGFNVTRGPSGSQSDAGT